MTLRSVNGAGNRTNAPADAAEGPGAGGRVRVFVSSPGDVGEERAIVLQVLQRLAGELSARGAVEPVFWEHEPLLATASFQEQITRPSECEVTIVILWSRLGTRLPAHITRPDGTTYASGTEFELEDAAAAFNRTGKHHLLVYRKTADPQVSLSDERALLARLEQKRALDELFARWFQGEGGAVLKAAFHPFSDPAELETLVEVHLRKLLERLLPERRPDVPVEQPARWQEGSPFRGLEVFELEHAGIFFGRTRAISDVLSALRRQAELGRAFVLILGMSGCGKSSLVRAGVLPMLMQPGVVEGVGLWRWAITRPSDAAKDLFAGLAAALLREGALPELAAGGTAPAELARILRDAPQAAPALLQVGLAQAPPPRLAPSMARLVLVVDQLEEIFTLEGITAEDRTAFIASLDVLARSGKVWVIATLRSDFYPRTTEIEALVALKEGAGQYDLLPPTPPEIAQMIRQPTLAAGLRFEVDPTTEERLDDVLRDAAAKDPAALPLLEFTLAELYKERNDQGVLTFEAYRRLGGVEGALARRAEEVFQSLPAEVEAALPAVLRSLVTLESTGEETASKRRAPLGELSRSPEGRMLVDTFVRARLFVAELDDQGSAVVDLAHEALLKNWPRMAQWLEEDRDNLRIRARVSVQAKLWGENGRAADYLLAKGKPLAEARELLERGGAELGEGERALIVASLARERRARRRRQALVASLAALALAATVLALVATSARRDAERRRTQAQDLIAFMLGDLREKLEPIGRLDVLGGAVDKALAYFHSLDDAELDRSNLLKKAVALQEIAFVRLAQGQLQAADDAAQEMMALTRRLVRRYPADAEVQIQLAGSHTLMAEMARARQDSNTLLAHDEASAKIIDGLAARDPGNDRWQEQAGVAHTNLAMDYQERGWAQDLVRAQAELQPALTNFRGLVARHPENSRWQNLLSGTEIILGDVYDVQGDFAGARGAYQSCLAIMQRLAASDAANVGWQRSLGYCHTKLGDVAQVLGESSASIEHYEAALDITARLARREPNDTGVAFEHANLENYLAWSLAMSGDFPRAWEHERAAVGAVESLLRKDPMREDWRKALGEIHRTSAEMLLASGSIEPAMREILQAKALLKQPGPRVYLLLGEILDAQGKRAEAREAWTKATTLLAPGIASSSNVQSLEVWVRALIHLGRSEDAKPARDRLAALHYRPLRPLP